MKAIEVRSLRRPDGSRRVGRRFGPEPQVFASDYFTKKELEVIDADPQLSMREVDADPKKVEIVGAKPETPKKGGGKEANGE